ncbi:MAG: zinc-binding dehydrogenase [Synergistaceae bacterium]|jgi:L-iditol 2-dehydrogenase|nr:zinc-binding dehydrogenase [Synergistaceae bacterium]
MKGLVKTAPGTLTLQELETPKPNGHDVILKVSHCGICGSDVHLWESDANIGLVLGHEFAGVVEDPGASQLKVGDYVAVIPGSSKGKGLVVGANVQGAYTTHFSQDPRLLLPVPKSVGTEVACMIEPFTVGLRAVRRSHIDIQEKVLITGAGIIGHTAAEWARLAGAETIVMIDINDKRIEFAKKHGVIDEILDAKDPDIEKILMEKTGGAGFEKVIECTGFEKPTQLSINVTKTGGQITYVGVNFHSVSIPFLPLVMREISIVGTWGGISLYAQEVLHHFETKRVNPIKYVTDRIPLERVQAKMEDLASGKSGDIKCLIVNE